MSNIITYPGIPIVAGDDLMIISDISVKGNPTKTVSVNQLGAYIGATGGGAGVATINGVAGAVTLVGGTNITLGVVGQNITINSTAENGTVTSVSSTVAGSALNVAVTNATTTPAVTFAWSGTNAQYVNGAGATVGINTLIASGALTLTTTGTSGAAAIVGNNLNIPNYATGVGYTTVTLILDPQGANAPLVTTLNNTIGGTFTITRGSAGVYEIANTTNPFTAKTSAFISNPNAEAPSSGTGSLPQPTTIRRKTTGLLSINCYKEETGTVSGAASDFGTFDVTVEIKIYP